MKKRHFAKWNFLYRTHWSLVFCRFGVRGFQNFIASFGCFLILWCFFHLFRFWVICLSLWFLFPVFLIIVFSWCALIPLPHPLVTLFARVGQCALFVEWIAFSRSNLWINVGIFCLTSWLPSICSCTYLLAKLVNCSIYSFWSKRANIKSLPQLLINFHFIERFVEFNSFAFYLALGIWSCSIWVKPEEGSHGFGSTGLRSRPNARRLCGKYGAKIAQSSTLAISRRGIPILCIHFTQKST